MNKVRKFSAAALGLAFAVATPVVAIAATPAPEQSSLSRPSSSGVDRGDARREATALERRRDDDLGRGDRTRPGRFTREENVFLPSAIAVDGLETPGRATVTLPLYTAVTPDGDEASYIITESDDPRVARQLGLNVAPRLAYAEGTGADQQGSVRDGLLHLEGDVDFSPEPVLVPGTTEVAPGTTDFPPAEASPGAKGDEAYSSLVQLDSGAYLNIAIVANGTGTHDRLVSIDQEAGVVVMQLLNGWQDDEEYYYHLVTDSSDPVASTIEKATWVPKLANLFADRQAGFALDEESALLGFSPTANGPVEGEDPQGLNFTVRSGGQDPVNVFPIDPDNRKVRGNQYSPMWFAHVSQWTQEAIDAGEQRTITGLEDLNDLVDRGLVTSFVGSPGAASEYLGGLRSTDIIINCPVIAQPFSDR